MPQTVAKNLEHAIAARADAMQALVAEFARYQTPTGDLAGLATLADAICKRYRALGARLRLIAREGGEVIIADFDGHGTARDLPFALLLGHYDTVHPRDSVPVVLEGHTLKGPGVYDMKGGLVVAETAVAVLDEAGLDRRPVRIVLTPDEEIGSPSSKDVVIDEATGAGYVIGLEPPHSDGSLKSSRHGSTRLRISVRGRAAHAALAPETGINAIDELCDRLAAVRQVLAEHPDVLANIGTVSGGGLTNVVPAAAHADIGLRFRTGRDEAEVLQKLHSLAAVRDGAEVKTITLSNRSPWESSAATEAFAAEVVRAASGIGVHIVAAPTAGAADTNLTGALGLPTLDGFGPVGSGAHADSEQILLASLSERVRLLAAVLHRV